MITRYAKKARQKGREHFHRTTPDSVVDFDFGTVFPSTLEYYFEPFEKEANLMVSRILHELKDKHRMTKKKYKFLTSKLMKYVPYTSKSRRHPHFTMPSDFDGDMLSMGDILKPAGVASSSREIMFSPWYRPGEGKALDPIFSMNFSIPEEDEDHRLNYISESEAEKLLNSQEVIMEPCVINHSGNIRERISRSGEGGQIIKHYIEGIRGRKAMILDKHKSDNSAFVNSYSCNCGDMVGIEKKGKRCELCNSDVVFRDIITDQAKIEEIYGDDSLTLSAQDIELMKQDAHPNLKIRDEFLFNEALRTGKVICKNKVTARFGNAGTGKAHSIQNISEKED